MDFSAWSPSHTVLVLFILAGFIGQVAIYFYKTTQNDKKIDKQSEEIKQLGETFFHALERLEDRMDKRFVEVITTMNQQIGDVRKEIGDVRSEVASVRNEMNQRLASMDDAIRQLNQNHIDHLTHHTDTP